MLQLKWIGASLIIFGCGSVGFAMAALYRKEEQVLQELSSALTHMISELEFRLTPLPELFDRISRQGTSCIYGLMAELSDVLKNQVAPDAGCCLEVVLRKYAKLPNSAAEILRELAAGLGQYDAHGQLQQISAVKERCLQELNELRIQKEERIRRYQTLGLCTGAAIAILLM